MRLLLSCILCLIVAIISTRAEEGMDCFTVHDCDCGESCVNMDDERCDDMDEGCMCKPGCTVFDKFINPGTSDKLYGNTCHCPHTIDHLVHNKERTPQCTRSMWHGRPEDMSPFERNYKCYTD